MDIDGKTCIEKECVVPGDFWVKTQKRLQVLRLVVKGICLVVLIVVFIFITALNSAVSGFECFLFFKRYGGTCSGEVPF